MEAYKFLIVMVVFYIIALIYDLLLRDRTSNKSPKGFNLVFYLKDNKQRLILSFVLSLFISIGVHMIREDIGDLAGKEIKNLNMVLYAIIGAAPDLLISYAKRKVSFLQPEEVDGFKRK